MITKTQLERIIKEKQSELAEANQKLAKKEREQNNVTSGFDYAALTGPITDLTNRTWNLKQQILDYERQLSELS